MHVLAVPFLLLILAYLSANGIYAATNPQGWIRAWWTLSGSIRSQDAQTLWGSLQVRFLGVGLTLFPVIGMVGPILHADARPLIAVIYWLFVSAALISGAVAAVNPETGMNRATREWLQKWPAAKPVWLPLTRAFGACLFFYALLLLARNL